MHEQGKIIAGDLTWYWRLRPFYSIWKVFCAVPKTVGHKMPYILAGSVLIVSGWAALDTYRTQQALNGFWEGDRAIVAAAATTEKEKTEETPDEAPTYEESTSGGATHSVTNWSLTIPTVGIHGANIIELGLDSQGNIDAPNNPYDVGWYSGSAGLGEKGANFLTGHYGYSNVKETFEDIANLAIGETIEVQKGVEVFRYQVRNNQTIQANEINMKEALAVYNGEDEGLNIMTCAGRYDSGSKTFDSRTIIWATRI